MKIRPESHLVKGSITHKRAGNIIFVFGRTPIPGHQQPRKRHIKPRHVAKREVELSPDVGSGIQSVLIPRTWGKLKANQYLQKNDYSISFYGKSPYTESKNYLRYRQETPNKNSQYIQRKIK